MNQKGDVQPIGDVKEKIEGFYDVCRQRGLNKHQGVIIPAQNVQELMLREDVIESVRKDEFHIYPITRIEEGMEILTGLKAGKKMQKKYEPGTVYELVAKKIIELHSKSKASKSSNSKTTTKKKK